MLSEYPFQKVYIRCGHTDLRKGINGLAALIQEEFGKEGIEKETLFLFCGGRSDRMKGLVWEGDGYLLLYKRIENGRFRWPRTTEEITKISREELVRLLQGYTILERSTIKGSSVTAVV